MLHPPLNTDSRSKQTHNARTPCQSHRQQKNGAQSKHVRSDDSVQLSGTKEGSQSNGPGGYDLPRIDRGSVDLQAGQHLVVEDRFGGGDEDGGAKKLED